MLQLGGNINLRSAGKTSIIHIWNYKLAPNIQFKKTDLPFQEQYCLFSLISQALPQPQKVAQFLEYCNSVILTAIMKYAQTAIVKWQIRVSLLLVFERIIRVQCPEDKDTNTTMTHTAYLHKQTHCQCLEDIWKRASVIFFPR